jgi:hypothetical protein
VAVLVVTTAGSELVIRARRVEAENLEKLE